MAGMEIQHIGTSNVSDDSLRTHISRLSRYRDELKKMQRDWSGYKTPESLLRLPTDKTLISEIETVEKKLSADSLTDVVVVGMGGSVRALRAVHELLADKSLARLHIIDTLSRSHISDVVTDLSERIDSTNQLAVCIVSKSGNTLETNGNANILLAELNKVFSSDIHNQVVVVGQGGSQLVKKASQSNRLFMTVPEQIPGRFSAFSAAGLLPLRLIGVDIEQLKRGARTMLEACLSGRAMADPASALAGILYEHTRENVRIINHIFDSPEARGLGQWLAQLFAESLGKRTNKRGEPVFSGLHPVTTIIPDDLHADLQLQLAGAKNFFSVFIEEKAAEHDLRREVTAGAMLPERLAGLAGKSLAEIREASTQVTKDSFRKSGRPFVVIKVDSFSPERVGQLILLEELIVIYLADLLEVNAFDQPQVEEMKNRLFDNLNI